MSYFSANFWMPAKMTDMKFPDVGHLNFTADKTDMPASIQEDCHILAVLLQSHS